MAKRPTNKQITGRLDRLARAICHARFGWKCVRCGETEHLHWSHIVQRFGHKALRWARQNSLTLCKDCHYWFDHNATARQQFLFVDRVSPGAFDWLEEVEDGVPRNEKKFDLTIDDMVELAEQLKGELDGIRKAENHAATARQGVVGVGS